MENQLIILSQSLDEKLKVLKEIQEYNLRQEQAFKEGKADLDGFDEAVEEKGKLIERLTRLDDGFEILYGKVADEIKANPDAHKELIKELQGKIARVTEMGVTIQAQEARNKKLVEEFFAKARKGLGESRKTSRAAYDYYKKVNGAAYNPSQFYDSKN